MKLFHCSAGIALWVLSVAAFALDNSRSIEPDVVYGHKDGLALTMDVFRPETDANGAAILFIMSGGWYSSWAPPEKTRLFFEPYLTEGYTVMAVRHGSSPRYSIKEIVTDVRRAVRFVRQNSSAMGIDPDRIGAMGVSAGGHLALMLGTTGDDGRLDADDVLSRVSSRVKAVVAFVPPTDLRVGIWGAADAPEDFRSFPALNISTEEAEQSSPLVYVTEDDAPSLVFVGGKDTLVPEKHGHWIEAAFKENDVPHKLIVYPDAGHDLLQKNRARAIPEAVGWFNRYLIGNPN